MKNIKKLNIELEEHSKALKDIARECDNQDLDADGTCYQGNITIDYQMLVDTFGEPDYVCDGYNIWRIANEVIKD